MLCINYLVTFTDWQAGEPNNAGGERCIEVLFKKNYFCKPIFFLNNQYLNTYMEITTK